jgi:CheY-like chemotaxis protein
MDGRFAVFQASSRRRGLALAREAQPDLILLDVVMPDIDGYETLQRLKADPQTAGIPVAYLMKPFAPMKLPATLLELGHR